MSKEIEDIGAPSRKILRAFVLWGHELAHTNVWKIPQLLLAELYLR